MFSNFFKILHLTPASVNSNSSSNHSTSTQPKTSDLSDRFFLNSPKPLAFRTVNADKLIDNNSVINDSIYFGLITDNLYVAGTIDLATKNLLEQGITEILITQLHLNQFNSITKDKPQLIKNWITDAIPLIEKIETRIEKLTPYRKRFKGTTFMEALLLLNQVIHLLINLRTHVLVSIDHLNEPSIHKRRFTI